MRQKDKYRSALLCGKSKGLPLNRCAVQDLELKFSRLCLSTEHIFFRAYVILSESLVFYAWLPDNYVLIFCTRTLLTSAEIKHAVATVSIRVKLFLMSIEAVGNLKMVSK